MLQVRITKGGEGSGNFGHAGRPGLVGGSTSVFDASIVDTASQLTVDNSTASHELYGYWILPDDRLFDINSPSFSERHISEHFAAIAAYPEKFGLNSADIADVDVSRGGFALAKFALAKNPELIRVRVWTTPRQGEIDIHVHTLNDTSLRRLQRLYDADKFKIKNNDVIILEYDGGSLHVSLFEFLDARHVIFDKAGRRVLKSDDVVEKQLPISDKSRAKLISVRNEIFKADVAKLAENMYLGTTSLGQWEETMKKMIRELHTSAASIAKGGWDNMTSADWGRIGTPMREQYRYLHNFAQHIAENRDEISLKAIQARAAMYGNAAGHTAVLMIAGAEISKLLPWMPRDGSTECLVNCQCRWELKVVDKLKDGMQVVQAVWKLGAAEHCLDCVNRMNHVEIITVSKDTTIPSVIGGF